MTTVFNLEISESPQQLQRLLCQHQHARDRDRLRALYLRKTGQVRSRRELAQGCNESTLYRWFWLYQQQGLEGLLEHHSPNGRPSELTPEIRQALEQKLSDPRAGEVTASSRSGCSGSSGSKLPTPPSTVGCATSWEPSSSEVANALTKPTRSSSDSSKKT